MKYYVIKWAKNEPGWGSVVVGYSLCSSMAEVHKTIEDLSFNSRMKFIYSLSKKAIIINLDADVNIPSKGYLWVDSKDKLARQIELAIAKREYM